MADTCLAFAHRVRPVDAYQEGGAIFPNLQYLVVFVIKNATKKVEAISSGEPSSG